MKSRFWAFCRPRVFVALSSILLLICRPEVAFSVPCKTDASVPGFNDLDELDKFVFSELIVFLQGEPARPAPYAYFLCPDTVYDVEASGKYFLPFLDETYFICGNDGSSDNNCIIRGGDIQAMIRNIHELADINYVHESTYFFGLTFEEYSNSSNDGTSIAAIDAAGTAVYFVDCVWRSGYGLSTIRAFFVDFSESETLSPTIAPTDDVSAFPSLSPSSVPSGVLSDMPSSYPSSSDETIRQRNLQLESIDVTGMNVTLLDCSVVESGPRSESLPFYALFIVSATLVSLNTEFNFNIGTSSVACLDSVIDIRNNYFYSNVMPYVSLVVSSQASFSATEFSNNAGLAMLFFYKALLEGRSEVNLFLGNTSFRDNVAYGSSVSLAGGTLDASFLTFENTWGAADISIHPESTSKLSDSCFVNGNYSIAPIVVDVNSTLKLNGDNFADGLISQQGDGQCVSPPGALFEEIGSDCFNQDDDEEDICSGGCRLFGGTKCFVPITRAPTPSTKTNAPTQTNARYRETP